MRTAPFGSAFGIAAAALIAAGPAAAQDPLAGLAPNQLAAVAVSATTAAGRPFHAEGTGFALTDRLLVTAAAIAGRPRDLAPEPGAAGFAGAPAPAQQALLTLRRPPADRATDEAAVLAPQGADPALALLAPVHEPLLALPLSACPVAPDAAYHLLTLAPADRSAAPDARTPRAVAARPLLRGGLFAQIVALDPPVGPAALGSPVVDAERRVIGAVTDLSGDGSLAYLTPALHIAAAAPDPQAIALACDPRVRRAEFDKLADTVARTDAALAARLDAVERRLNGEVATRMNVLRGQAETSLSMLGDLKGEMEQLNTILQQGGDPSAALQSLSDKVRRMGDVKLVPTVSEIDSYLRRPEWTLRIKLDDTGFLDLNLSYSSALKGPPYAQLIEVCLRPLVPQTHQSREDVLKVGFYRAMTRQNAQCTTTKFPLAQDALVNKGAYRTNIAVSDVDDVFQEKRELLGFGDLPWTGLAYLSVRRVVAEEEQAPGGGDRRDEELVEMHALIDALPAGDGSGLRSLPCLIFPDEQSIINFIAAKKPEAWDDPEDVNDPAALGLELPAEETCASASS